MNKVSDQWTWAWVCLLVVIALACAAIAVVEYREKELKDNPAEKDRLRLVQNITYSLAALGVAAVFVALLVVPRFVHARSCFDGQSVPDFPLLPYRCNIAWDRAIGSLIKVHPTASDSQKSKSPLLESNHNHYFMCEVFGEQVERNGKKSSWWAFTQGDEGQWWGYVSELHFVDGPKDEDDSVLPTCSGQEKPYRDKQISQKGLRLPEPTRS